MNTIKLDIVRKMLHAVLLMAVSLMVVACSMMHDDYEPMPEQLSDAYISVTVSAGHKPSATRGPQGGEDGDGRIDAWENEYKISNLTLLLYKGGTDGINSTNNPTIEHAIYFSSFTETTNGTDKYDNKAYTTFTRKLDSDIERNKYNVIAIVNAGDLSETLKNKSLNDVRNYIITNQWTSGATIYDYTNFVMTSAADATIDMTTGEGSISNPFEATIDVERLAARIDMDVTGASYNEGVYYEYGVDGSDTHKFRLKSIQVTNMLSSGSYLIKRVATGATATGGASAVYLGNEEATGGLATNYVLDPWTLSKTSANRPDGLAYGNSTAISVTNDTTTENGETFFPIAYVQENTLPNADNLSTYATALVITGEYVSDSETKTITKTYYLRHADPNDNAEETSPMKYGVVRNNIYRVKISKVNKREDSPTTDVSLTLNIKVKKWNMVVHEEIVM